VTGGAGRIEDVHIRPAREADYIALCSLFKAVDELHARLLPSYFKRSPRPPRTREEIDKILRAPDETILSAVDGEGYVIGLVHVQIYDTPAVAMMVPKRRAHIDNLVVDEGVRRRGLGRRLLQTAAEWSRARGAEELLLTVWEGNEAAYGFYEKMGFSRINTVLGRSLR
jgi:ribosomal protein S18 acetylase RimI-like enzyme